VIHLDVEGDDEDTEPLVFKYLLEYMYNDTVEMTDEINDLVVPILIGSSKYGRRGSLDLFFFCISI
jgi:hypothetical protein